MFYSIQTSEDGTELLLFGHFHDEYEAGKAPLPSEVIGVLQVENPEAYQRAKRWQWGIEVDD
jgi:hypothetical protein